jgi:hypothetical protein
MMDLIERTALSRAGENDIQQEYRKNNEACQPFKKMGEKQAGRFSVVNARTSEAVQQVSKCPS